MRYMLDRGWVQQARAVPSPNCGPRPPGTVVDLLVIHNISLPPGCFGGDAIEQLFTNCLDWTAHPFYAEICGLEVSAHFLIRRCGELVQFVATDLRAWHAGLSCWRDRENCNDFSIGVELEGADEVPYTDAQYATLASLTDALIAYYPGLCHDHLAGHADIAPGRKTDPGPAFDWSRFRASLASAGDTA